MKFTMLVSFHILYMCKMIEFSDSNVLGSNDNWFKSISLGKCDNTKAI